MSDETQEMPAAAPAPSPSRPLSPAEEKVQKAMDLLGRVIAASGSGEKQVLNDLRQQTDQAARMSGSDFDKRLEFCYAIVFSPELSSNQRLQSAAQAYIDAVKAMQEF